jgi:Protein of unknown function (DUF2815)
MKTLKSSIVIQNAIVGMNSLRDRDTKFKQDGDYHLTALLLKDSQELKEVMKYITEVLKKENLTMKAELKKDKSPINENKMNGDIIAQRMIDEDKKNDKGEFKGQHLKGTYGIKIRTTKDYKVIDTDNKELDKTKINWTGAEVNIHCSPYIYNNNFGKGLTIILNAIQVVNQGSFGVDTIEDAFGGTIEENDDELPF